jgi:hypothetical protein
VELRRPQLEQAPQLQGGNEGVGERLARDDGDRRDRLAPDLRHENRALGHSGGVEVGEPPERSLVIGPGPTNRHRIEAKVSLALAILGGT